MEPAAFRGRGYSTLCPCMRKIGLNPWIETSSLEKVRDAMRRSNFYQRFSSVLLLHSFQAPVTVFINENGQRRTDIEKASVDLT